MKAKSSLDNSFFSHIKRRLSLITRITVNTMSILHVLLVVSLTLLAQSRLYKGELCIPRVQYHSLLGHSQGVIQRRIMLTESSVSLLTGLSQGCLTTEKVRLCYSMYSLYWDKPRLRYFIGGTHEVSLLDYSKV